MDLNGHQIRIECYEDCNKLQQLFFRMMAIIKDWICDEKFI
jgi:hypothetical protein